jgi:ribose 5-phosphate isomerase A
MTVGLGGIDRDLLPRRARGRSLELRCIATSPTEEQARRLGLPVEPFSQLDRLDWRWTAPTRSRRTDGSSRRRRAHAREDHRGRRGPVVIASSDKVVERISPPIPLELIAYGLPATLRALRTRGETSLRGTPPSPDGGVIADYLGPMGDPAELAAALDATPGVVAHGLFGPALVSLVLVGRAETVEHVTFPGGEGRP